MTGLRVLISYMVRSFREENVTVFIYLKWICVVTLHLKNASAYMLTFRHLHDALWHHIKGALDKCFFLLLHGMSVRVAQSW